MTFQAWLKRNGNRSVDSTQRAIHAWNRIQQNPTPIEVERGGVMQNPQTVRVSYNTRAQEEGFAGGESVHLRLVLFGVRDHPDIPDTDLQRGDMVYLNQQAWVVQVIAYYPGQIQALAEAQA
jgi:hypothetical protein